MANTTRCSGGPPGLGRLVIGLPPRREYLRKRTRKAHGALLFTKCVVTVAATFAVAAETTGGTRGLAAAAFQPNAAPLSPSACETRPVNFLKERRFGLVHDPSHGLRWRRNLLMNSLENNGADCESDVGSDTEANVQTSMSLGEDGEQEELGRIHTYSGRFLEDNFLTITTDNEGRVTARPDVPDSVSYKKEATEASAAVNSTVSPEIGGHDSPKPERKLDKKFASVLHRKMISKPSSKQKVREQPAKVVPMSGFNVVLTHCTADFDSLASAVGLAKLWSSTRDKTDGDVTDDAGDAWKEGPSKEYDSSSDFPTFVVLPRGAHPAVHKFLALHKHLFPIRSLRSLPSDLSGLNRLGLVDAQRRDRLGPAEHLLGWAKRVTVVDHHIDAESDIPEATDYVVDEVGSVSTMVVERLQESGIEITEAEATLLALGIHADTGSLCYDSTTPRDVMALGWVMQHGASQAAISEHAKSSLSPEQQGVLTQALIFTNSTVVHGVTVSTVLLSADGFINGLASVTQDAMELSSSDVFLLAVVYDAKSGGSRKKRRSGGEHDLRLTSNLLHKQKEDVPAPPYMLEAEAWKGGEEALKRRRLRAAFDKKDVDGSGYLERDEITAALSSSGVIATEEAVDLAMAAMDADGDGRVDFEEFVLFASNAEKTQKEHSLLTGRRTCTMIVIGRVKAGVSVKAVNLNRLFQQFGGGGHAKAASTTIKLGDEDEAEGMLQGLVDELIETSLLEQPTVGDFMTAPVLSAKPSMTEKQVEDLFTRYDVRALPVVDDNNDVIGLVTYKEVAAAKQRLWNKEQKRLRQEAKEDAADKQHSNKGEARTKDMGNKMRKERRSGNALKGWMKQHVRVVGAGMTMAEVEAVLLENDVGCIPVVADGTKQLVGMVTRTDLLRQHRYYPSLHYHNKGFSDSIAARKPIIELRKKLKRFDLED